MKIAEIRDMKMEELHSELERLRRHVFDLRSQAVTEKLQDSSLIRKSRRDIARVMTLLRQRGETDTEEKLLHMEAVSAKQQGK
jgi:large subunit ribosomal protein L29